MGDIKGHLWRRGLRCLAAGILVLGLAGCGKKPAGTEAAGNKAAAADTAAGSIKVPPRDLFAAMQAGEIRATILRKQSASLYGSINGNFINGYSLNYWLTLENPSGRTLSVALPKYLVGTHAQEPGEDKPVPPLFARLAGDLTMTLEPGRKAEKFIDNTWFAGAEQHSWNFEDLFTITPAPGDSFWPALAEGILANPPPVKEKCGDSLFRIVTAPMSEAEAAQAAPHFSYADVVWMEEQIRKLGMDPAQYPVFAINRKLRNDIIAILKKVLDTPAPEGGRMYCGYYMPELKGDLFAKDAEFAQVACRFIDPDGNGGNVHLYDLNHLEHLDVRGQAVLDTLWNCALKAGSEFLRIKAACVAVKFGDGRCVPLLQQYFGHPEPEDREVAAALDAAGAALVEFGKLHGGGAPAEAGKPGPLQDFLTPDSPGLAGMPEPERTRLKEFLAAGSNLRPGALEALLAAARGTGRPEERSAALVRLAGAAKYRADNRVLPLFEERMLKDPDLGVRYDAVNELGKFILGTPGFFTARPSAEAALLQTLKGLSAQSPEKLDAAGRNLLGITMATLRNGKSRGAVPELLAFLDGKDYFAQEASAVLTAITGLNPADKSRKGWETALAGK